MPGNRLVKRRRLRHRAALFLGLIRTDVEEARPAAVFGRRVVLAGAVLFPVFRVRLDGDVSLRQQPEPRGRRRLGTGQRRLRVGDQLLPALEHIAAIGAQLLEHRGHVGGLKRTAGDRPHLGHQRVHLPQPQLVNFLGRHRQRAELTDRRVVAGEALGMRADADLLSRGRQILALEKLAVLAERRQQLRRTQLGEALLNSGDESRTAGDRNGDPPAGSPNPPMSESSCVMTMRTLSLGAEKPWRRPSRRLAISTSRYRTSAPQRASASRRAASLFTG